MPQEACATNVIFLLYLQVLVFGVQSQMCSPGTVAHKDHSGQIVCCKPVDCDPDNQISFCEKNGTQDKCEPCQRNYRLFKRTSSFHVENCRYIPLDVDCKYERGPMQAEEEDKRNCFCDLEMGKFYKEPQIPLGKDSYCQIIRDFCAVGQQPTQNGDCKNCPPNTVQDAADSFKLCRPQRNCTAMNLRTLEEGSTSKVAVCEEPPPQPTVLSTKGPPENPPVQESSPSPSTPTPFTTTEDAAKIGSSLGLVDNSNTILIVVCCVLAFLVVLGGFIGFLFYRRRWCSLNSQNHHPVNGSVMIPCTQYPGQVRDVDNESANSCCACADNCLSSSNKPGGNNSGKAGPSDAGDGKQNGFLSHPKLESAYINMNGSVNGSFASGKISMSEPMYNSISHDSPKVLDDDYKNVNGGHATFLRQDDFYPTKVSLASSDDDDIKNTKLQNRADKRGKDSRDFSETDPLLGNDSISSNTRIPILANQTTVYPGGNIGSNLQVMTDNNFVGRNRPNLSMLLLPSSSLNPTPASIQRGGNLPQNLPHLSQLVSSVASCGGQRPVGTDESQRPEQDFSTLQTRKLPAVPVNSHPPDLRCLQIDELKPIMPSDPSIMPAGDDVLVPGFRSEMPASELERTNQKPAVSVPKPSQQTKAANRPVIPPQAAHCPDLEQTFRKEQPVTISGQEETARKSVGGSSGLGESLDMSSFDPASEEGRQSRVPYKRSVSEMSRSISPSPLPLPRSISSPEEKHRPFAVVKPMQSDQALNQLDTLGDLMQPLESAGRHYPLHSTIHHSAFRQSPNDSSSDDPNLTRPKTPDRLSEEEEVSEDENADIASEPGAGPLFNRASAWNRGDNPDHKRDGRDRSDRGKEG